MKIESSHPIPSSRTGSGPGWVLPTAWWTSAAPWPAWRFARAPSRRSRRWKRRRWRKKTADAGEMESSPGKNGDLMGFDVFLWILVGKTRSFDGVLASETRIWATKMVIEPAKRVISDDLMAFWHEQFGFPDKKMVVSTGISANLARCIQAVKNQGFKELKLWFYWQEWMFWQLLRGWLNIRNCDCPIKTVGNFWWREGLNFEQGELPIDLHQSLFGEESTIKR